MVLCNSLVSKTTNTHNSIQRSSRRALGCHPWFPDPRGVGLNQTAFYFVQFVLLFKVFPTLKSCLLSIRTLQSARILRYQRAQKFVWFFALEWFTVHLTLSIRRSRLYFLFCRTAHLALHSTTPETKCQLHTSFTRLHVCILGDLTRWTDRLSVRSEISCWSSVNPNLPGKSGSSFRYIILVAIT